MIEPNYDSLSLPRLQQLCHERKIKYDISMSKTKLIEKLLDHDYERAVSNFNPE